MGCGMLTLQPSLTLSAITLNPFGYPSFYDMAHPCQRCDGVIAQGHEMPPANLAQSPEPGALFSFSVRFDITAFDGVVLRHIVVHNICKAAPYQIGCQCIELVYKCV